MKIFIAVAYYIFQPILWIGLIRTYLVYTKRLNNERHLFRSAIYGNFFEGRHFIRSSVLLGILGSILGIFFNVSIQWLVVYEVLVLLNLLLIPFATLGVVLVGIAGLIAMYVPLGQLGGMTNLFANFGIRDAEVLPSNFLAITVIIIILNGLFITLNGGNFPAPRASFNRRHNRVTEYRFNEMTIVPFVVLLPGNWFSSHIAFWPVFQLGNHSYSLLVIPILLGLRMTIKHAVPRAHLVQLGHHVLYLGLLGIALIIVNIFVKGFVGLSIGLVLILYLGIIVISKIADSKVDFEYAEMINGVRVLGIIPGTPAAKMNLEIGDIILTVNGSPVANEDDLYRAISSNSTYCKMRVKNRNDQLKITETAIFKGSPHEIGIKTYSEV